MPEPWLRGPIPGIPALLQPAAHAFVMAREDIDSAVAGLSEEQVWLRPGGVASVGFHIAHLAGSTDRLMTYARGEPLNQSQKAALVRERTIDSLRPPPPLAELLADWHHSVQAALDQLAATPEASLLGARTIGRQQLPTTVLGALFHAAEHAARHAGQIVTTAKVVATSASSAAPPTPPRAAPTPPA